MQTTRKKRTRRENPVLERFLGAAPEVLDRRQMAVSQFIHAELLTVANTPQENASEEGRLFLFPIEDHQYHLHLLFLRPLADDKAEVWWLQYFPEFFLQYPPDLLLNNPPFRFDQSTELQFVVCVQSQVLLEQFSETGGVTPLIQALRHNEICLQLLRRSIESVTVPFTACPVPACRFLAHDSEREKIFEARRIIEQSIDQPLTIKELARKVAMNECYLKKGFKTLVGKTINEYQQSLRISKAKALLQLKSKTVSEVASELGYSSISHFSTAFKKATGLKPCELLG